MFRLPCKPVLIAVSLLVISRIGHAQANSRMPQILRKVCEPSGPRYLTTGFHFSCDWLPQEAANSQAAPEAKPVLVQESKASQNLPSEGLDAQIRDLAEQYVAKYDELTALWNKAEKLYNLLLDRYKKAEELGDSTLASIYFQLSGDVAVSMDEKHSSELRLSEIRNYLKFTVRPEYQEKAVKDLKEQNRLLQKKIATWKSQIAWTRSSKKDFDADLADLEISILSQPPKPKHP